MAKYEVLEDFTDLQDNNHIYRKGDHYPHKGQGKKKRIEELLGSENLRGEPLIKELEGNE
ncbi:MULTISPECIES: hypothetical protein [Bacillus]|uniref:hypothetical protein n=1 Tax=Bacillus TaxID=1386 RepID=UPI0003465549|nr:MULTISPECIES: hypothetical protein [Bacillus cereus group]PEB07769.1 hypothetical protein COM56_06275 [Bacillus cereus]AWC31862.1 hypothetical protein CG482_005145 [Bacillus cytotoxicus]AWC35900.1 hypothetical protein CG481_005150 [Bacillus cytotoxicus]AWC60140.1 hypothetical protein CG474_005220 [Bacillus cytotoxicus]KMT50360.1 hypothetical protein TU51_04940 [Bacillus cytotoxicus]